MKKIVGFLFVAIVLLSFAPHAEAVTILPTDDCFVDSSDIYANQEGWNMLKVKKDIYNSFLKFDLSLIPDGAAINWARLHLYAYNIYRTNSLSVNCVNDNTWTEGGITWFNQPTMGSSISSLDPINTGPLFFELSLGVPDDGIFGDVSLAIYQVSGDGESWFYSEEFGDRKKVYLEIDYTPVPEPCSLFLVSLGLLGTGIFKRRFKKNGHCV